MPLRKSPLAAVCVVLLLSVLGCDDGGESDDGACSPDPCVNGTCSDVGGNASCACDAGWVGDVCDTPEGSGCGDLTADAPLTVTYAGTDVGATATYACGDGFVLDGSATRTCEAVGWSGAAPTCVPGADPCEPDPCQNGGSCVADGTDSFHCECIDGYTGDLCETPAGPTTCLLTYDLVVGNGENNDSYADTNMRIRDTFMGMGDMTVAVGPGTLVLRVPADGDGNPGAGLAEVLYYHVSQEFTTTVGATITTDVDAASPDLDSTDNSDAVATGELALGDPPTIAWGACDLPAGWSDGNETYTPDVEATGAGCLTPYQSSGNVNCSGAFCSAGGLSAGDNPQDETWEQPLETFTFAADLSSFTMPFVQVPNRTPSRTHLSLGGTLSSTLCD